MRILSRPSGYAAAALLAGAAALAVPAMASAAISPPPNVPCDPAALVAAIQHANGLPAGTPATLLLAGNCNYALTAPAAGDDGLPAITGSLTMTGAQGTTISRSSGASFRIIDVAPGGSLTLSGVTVSNGRTRGNGGGILDQGTLSLQNVQVTGNSAANGGGLFVLRSASVSDSSFSGNSAFAFGGGIQDQGSLSLQSVQLNSNTAAGGGGLGVAPSAQATLSSSSLSGNTASHSGGGIENAGRLSADQSPLSGNTAKFSGGGLSTDVQGTSRVSNTVVSHNRALAGGGIANTGSTLLTGDRVVFNRAFNGGGIFTARRAPVVLQNTVVFGNALNNCTPRFTIRGCLH